MLTNTKYCNTLQHFFKCVLCDYSDTKKRVFRNYKRILFFNIYCPNKQDKCIYIYHKITRKYKQKNKSPRGQIYKKGVKTPRWRVLGTKKYLPCFLVF